MGEDHDTDVIAVSDLHGREQLTANLLEAVSGYEGDKVAVDDVIDTGGPQWTWEGGEEYTLIINGDVIDRGPSSDELLQDIFALQDDAPEGHVVYNIGNHEVFALFPDVFADLYTEYVVDSRDELEGDDTYHWWWLDDELREELLERTADGRITAAYDTDDYTYIHAGSNEPFDTSELNKRLEDAGDELLDGFQESEAAYRAAQEQFVSFDVDDGKEVAERYAALFGSDGVRGPDAGVLLMDFRHIDDTAPPQVVGHTTADGLPDAYEQVNPQAVGDVVNINTVRDAVNRDDVEPAAAVETDALYTLQGTDPDALEEERYD